MHLMLNSVADFSTNDSQKVYFDYFKFCKRFERKIEFEILNSTYIIQQKF